MMRRRSPAFVLGMESNGLGIIRSLGEAGIPVVGVDCHPESPGFASRFCLDRVLCADPLDNPAATLDQLLSAACTRPKPAVLIPSGDAFILFMSRHRKELSPAFLFDLPDERIVEALLDKRLQYQLAAEAGTPFPATFYPRAELGVERIKHVVRYPAFLKPVYSHEWVPVFQNKGFQVDTPEQLARRYAEVEPTGLDVVVQEVIPGPDSNVYEVTSYIDRRGRPRGVFTQRKLRQYPPHFGVGTLVDSVDLPDLARVGLAFFEGIDYRGLGSIELKYDDRTGRFMLIELNARLSMQNWLATRCGINFPLIAYSELLGLPYELPQKIRVGVRWLDLFSDLLSGYRYYQSGELSLVGWARSMGQARVFSLFDWRDPMPFIRAREGGPAIALLALGRIFGVRRRHPPPVPLSPITER